MYQSHHAKKNSKQRRRSLMCKLQSKMMIKNVRKHSRGTTMLPVQCTHRLRLPDNVQLPLLLHLHGARF
jgi:hypothetical protein